VPTWRSKQRVSISAALKFLSDYGVWVKVTDFWPLFPNTSMARTVIVTVSFHHLRRLPESVAARRPVFGRWGSGNRYLTSTSYWSDVLVDGSWIDTSRIDHRPARLGGRLKKITITGAVVSDYANRFSGGATGVVGQSRNGQSDDRPDSPDSSSGAH